MDNIIGRKEMANKEEYSKPSYSKPNGISKKQVPFIPLHPSPSSSLSSPSSSSSLPYIRLPYRSHALRTLPSSATHSLPSLKNTNLSPSTTKASRAGVSPSRSRVPQMETASSSSDYFPSALKALSIKSSLSPSSPLSSGNSLSKESAASTSVSSSPYLDSSSTASLSAPLPISTDVLQEFTTTHPTDSSTMAVSSSSSMKKLSMPSSPSSSSVPALLSLASTSSLSGDIGSSSSSSPRVVHSTPSSTEASSPPSAPPSPSSCPAASTYETIPFSPTPSLPMKSTSSSLSLDIPPTAAPSATAASSSGMSSSTAPSSIGIQLSSSSLPPLSSSTSMSCPSKRSSKFSVLPETSMCSNPSSTFKDLSSSVTVPLQAESNIATESSSSLRMDPPLLLTDFMAKLQFLLNNLVVQRNTIMEVMNTAVVSFLPDVSLEFIQEQKILNQVMELQAKIVSISEELRNARAKNDQLEKELASYLSLQQL